MIFTASFGKVSGLDHRLDEHFASLATLHSLATGRASPLPAGGGSVVVGRAAVPLVWGAFGNLPTGGELKQHFDARDTDPLYMDQAAQATDPLNIIVGVITLTFHAGRLDETLGLIDSQRPRVDRKKFCRNTDRVNWRSVINTHVIVPRICRCDQISCWPRQLIANKGPALQEMTTTNPYVWKTLSTVGRPPFSLFALYFICPGESRGPLGSLLPQPK